MFLGYFPKFTFNGGTDERHGDGFGMIVDGQSMLVDGFEGGEPTDRLLAWLVSKGVKSVDVVVITHWHYDHIHGLLEMLESGKVTFKTVYCIDPLTYKHGCDGSANGKAVAEDMDNAYKVIRKMQSYGARVLWKNHGDVITIGDIHWHIFRKQPTTFTEYDDGHAYAFVNDGSLVLYSPELQGMLPGDGPCEQKEAIAYFQRLFGKSELLKWTDITHHGGSWSRSNAESAKNAGCELAFESCIEADGAGTSGWTQYGARRLVQQGITVWMQDKDINITASNGKIVFTHGSEARTMSIPYSGKCEAGWVKNQRGWWYKFSDGTWAIGWKLLPWSKGKSWFYFDSDGYMVTGWHKLAWSGGVHWFYFDPTDGYMVTGWRQIKSAWYYLDLKHGFMWASAWIDWKNKRCYLGEDGKALCNCVRVIDGKTYRFDGACYATELSSNTSSMAGISRVIDLSEHNDKSIDWSKVKSAGYGVIIRMGLRGSMKQYPTVYGKIRYDNNYKAYLDGIIKAGIPYSVYFFPTSISDAEADEEAEWIRMNVIGLALSMPVYLDSEMVDSGNGRADGLSRADRTRYLKRIIDKLKSYGIECGVYASTSWLNNKLDMSQLSGVPVWCAQYASKCTYSGDYVMWQYSSKASVPGIDGNVDISQIINPIPSVDQNAVDVLIGIAQAEVGYHEGANNSNKYGDELHAIQPSNMDKNAAWCDAFVDWCILQTCRQFGKDADTARAVLCGDFDDYTYFSVNLYKKAGRWTQTPARGYQIFFGGSGHTGIVTNVIGNTVHTIEGNKSDAVRECSYSKSDSRIIGYGMPRYDLI